MSHYFIENPDILTRERELRIDLFGKNLRFLTNNGLFSCDKIDDASLMLVQNMPPITGTLLDLGCGYGFIGIALAIANSIILTQSDINSLALSYAKKNAQRNNITANQIHSNSFENIPSTFDNIVLNPPIHAGKSIMYRLYEDSANALNTGGSLFICHTKKTWSGIHIKKVVRTLHKLRNTTQKTWLLCNTMREI